MKWYDYCDPALATLHDARGPVMGGSQNLLEPQWNPELQWPACNYSDEES